MLTVKIPLSNNASFRQIVLLAGVKYKLLFNWNTRGQYWTVSFYDLDNILLIAGIKVVLDIDIIKQYQSYAMPAGKMFFIDKSGSKKPIGRNDFKNRITLYFTES